MVEEMELAEVYSSYSTFSRSLSYPRIFTTSGKTDIDKSLFSKALQALNLEVHLLRPILPIRTSNTVPHVRILRSFVCEGICSDGHVRKWHS